MGAVILGDTVYTIDGGKLKAVGLRSNRLREVQPLNGTVQDHPIQELAALAYAATTKTLYLLDRTGAVYGWDLGDRWWVERSPGANSSYAQEYPVALAANDQTVYLLDTNNGRVWRKNSNGWVAFLTSSQLVGGIQMAWAGDLLILVGERPGRSARLLRLRGTALSEVSVSGGMEEPSLIIGAGNANLFLIDRRFRRVRLIETGTGNGQELLGGTNADILALAAAGEDTALLGADWLISIKGQLREQLFVRPLPPTPASLPHNLAMLATLPRLRMPVARAHLPDIDRSLPGAPRPYRYGIHEGIDLYSSTVGVPVVKGSPVLAAADGVVVRADVDYKEATAAQVDAWLAECVLRRMTPPAIQDRLGGRQVWIDHGNGVSTRYLHLSGIANGITVGIPVKTGQIIAFAGNSGTPEAAAGSSSDVHLHVEVRIGNGYLGQWISPIETRRILGRIMHPEQ